MQSKMKQSESTQRITFNKSHKSPKRKEKTLVEEMEAFRRYVDKKAEKLKNEHKQKRGCKQVEPQMFSLLTSMNNAARSTAETMTTINESMVIPNLANSLGTINQTTQRVNGMLERIETMFGESGKQVYSKIVFTTLRLVSDHSLFGVILVIIEFVWDYMMCSFDPLQFLIENVWPFVQRAVELLLTPLKVCNRRTSIPIVEGQSLDIKDFDITDVDWTALLPMGAGVATLLACIFYGRHTMADRDAMRTMTSMATYGANLTKIKSGIRTSWDFVQQVILFVKESLMEMCPGLAVSKTTCKFFSEMGLNIGDFVQRVERITNRSDRLRILTDVNTATEIVELNRISAKIALVLARETYKPSAGALSVISTTRKKLSDFIREFEVDNAANSIRPTPFHVSLYGKPGCGKSNITGFLATDLVNPDWSTVGIDPSIPPYTRNAADKYWSGYVQQPVVIMDDFAQTRGETPSSSEYLELIFMISGISWRPVMSKNEDKGLMFTSRLVISTTNTPFPKPTEVASAEAIWRRRNVLVRVDAVKECDDLRDASQAEFTIMDPMKSGEVIKGPLTYAQLVEYCTEKFNAFDENDKRRKAFQSMLKPTEMDGLRKKFCKEVVAEMDDRGLDDSWGTRYTWDDRWKEFRNSLRRIHMLPERQDPLYFYENPIPPGDEHWQATNTSLIWPGNYQTHRTIYSDRMLQEMEKWRCEPWFHAYRYKSYDEYRGSPVSTDRQRNWKLEMLVGVPDVGGEHYAIWQDKCDNCHRFDCDRNWSSDFNGIYWQCEPKWTDAWRRPHHVRDRALFVTQHRFQGEWMINHYKLGFNDECLMKRTYHALTHSAHWHTFLVDSLPKWQDLTQEDREGVFVAFLYGIVGVYDFWPAKALKKEHQRWLRESGPLAHNDNERSDWLTWRNVASAYKLRYYNRITRLMQDFKSKTVEVQTLEFDFEDDMWAREAQYKHKYQLWNIAMETEYSEIQKNFMEKVKEYPRVATALTALTVAASIFGLYKLYKIMQPQRQAESGGGPSGDSRTMRLKNAKIVRESESWLSYLCTDEQNWLAAKFDKVHQKYWGRQDELTPSEQAEWNAEVKATYELYHELKRNGYTPWKQAESGGGPSGDSRTMRLKNAKIVRESEEILDESHGSLQEGVTYHHYHKCVKCETIFDHTHAIHRQRQHLYTHLCKTCRNVKPEGSEDDGGLQLLMKNIAPKNCVELELMTNGRVRRMCALGLRDRLILAPWHLFSGLTGEHLLEVRRHKFGSTYHNIRMARDVHRLKGRAGLVCDLVIVELSHTIPSFPNILKHFVTDRDMYKLARVVGQLTRVKTADGELSIFPNHDVMIRSMTEQVQYSVADGSTLLLKGLEYHCATTKGDCGAILTVLNTQIQGMIAGIHLAGDRDASRGYAAQVTREMLEQELDRFGLNNGESVTMAEMLEFEPPTDTINVIPEGNLVVVGQAKRGQGERFVNKTDIIPSALHGKVAPPTTFPSVLAAHDPRVTVDVHTTPMEKALQKFSEPIIPFSRDTLDLAEQIMFNKIDKYSPKGLGRRLLTMEEAINGVPAAGYQRINMLTSPGRPYKIYRPAGSKGKRFLFEELSQDPLVYGINEFTGRLLKERLEARWRLAKMGKRLDNSYGYSNLKDERRKLAKIEAGSTRSFDCMPLDFNLLCRIYFGAYIAAKNQNCADIPSSVGIDPTGTQWSRLYHRLNRFGGQVFAGDYKGWDGKFDGEVAHRICRNINKWYDDGPVNAKVRFVLFDEIIHTFLLAGDTLMQKSQGLPSGVIVTADLNSDENWMYFLTALIELEREERQRCIEQGEPEPPQIDYDHIDNYVEWAFYGDDHVVAPSQEIQKWFNFTTVSAFYTRHKIGYTDAQKSGREVPPLEPLMQTTYLKRGFVPHDRNPERILAPIDKNTIMEEINWIRKSADDVAALYQNLNTVKREAYHHGETYFNETIIKINEGLRSLRTTELSYTSESIWELLTRDYEVFDERWNEQFLN